MQKDKESNQFKVLFALVLAVGVYSFSAVFGKFSANFDILSWQWILLYGASIGTLFLYSMVWQLILEKITLSKAYLSKGFYYAYILLWSALIFKEQISWNQLVGVVIITIGIMVGNSNGNR